MFTLYNAELIMHTQNAFIQVFSAIFNYAANYLDSNVGGYVKGSFSTDDSDSEYPIITLELLFPYDLEYTQTSVNNYFENNIYVNEWKIYSNYTKYNTFWKYQENIWDENHFRIYTWSDFIPAKNLTSNFTNVIYDAFQTTKQKLSSGMLHA